MSRRSRAVTKGVIAANRREERRAAWQATPVGVKVGLFATLAALVSVMALLGTLAGHDRPTAPPTTAARGSAEDECVSMRVQWNQVVDRDFEGAQRIQTRYRAAGCYSLCGDLVEDTDTPQRETRCGDDAIIPNTVVGSDRTTAATAPPMPGSIPGYEPLGPPVKLTLRLFEKGRPTLVDDFPVTMNGCSNGMSTTRWRSLVGEVTAAVTSFTDHPDNVDRSDIRERTTARAGLVRTEHQCDQPVFISSVDGIVDVAVEYQAWNASP